LINLKAPLLYSSMELEYPQKIFILLS